jgi:hypothetical protein
VVPGIKRSRAGQSLHAVACRATVRRRFAKARQEQKLRRVKVSAADQPMSREVPSGVIARVHWLLVPLPIIAAADLRKAGHEVGMIPPQYGELWKATAGRARSLR